MVLRALASLGVPTGGPYGGHRLPGSELPVPWSKPPGLAEGWRGSERSEPAARPSRLGLLRFLNDFLRISVELYMDFDLMFYDCIFIVF